jgi:ribosome recycling factor
MENELVELVMDDTRERMAKAIEHVKVEFANVRTGRASSSLVENILVDYYGAETPLKQLANFSVPEPRMLVVSPFDKGAMNAIEKAISNADLGLNPSNDGIVIRLSFPKSVASPS